MFDLIKNMMGKRGGGGAGAVAGGVKTGNPLLDALLPMLLAGGAGGAAGGLGGLGGLIGKFTQSGMGAKAQSWVSTGPNEDLGADEVQQALGEDTIGRLAGDTGMSPDEVKGGLAGMLPGLVDQLTPGGQLPDAGKLGGMLGGLDLAKVLGR
ncbi:MAG: YidB family protein [Acidimicrobiales bacterium]